MQDLEALPNGVASKALSLMPPFGRNARKAKLYDLLAAAPAVLWFGLGGGARLAMFEKDLSRLNGTALDMRLGVSLLADAATIILIFAILVFLLLRVPAKAKAKGLGPRISAFIGTYLAVSIVWLPQHPMGTGAAGLALSLLSVILIFLGVGFSIFSLAHLGRAFSLMAEARQLVTDGPYAYIRHPLYLGEGVAVLGLLLQYISPLALAIVALQWAFQCERMANEERVLGQEFPEYAAYRARTARLIPGLY